MGSPSSEGGVFHDCAVPGTERGYFGACGEDFNDTLVATYSGGFGGAEEGCEWGFGGVYAFDLSMVLEVIFGRMGTGAGLG